MARAHPKRCSPSLIPEMRAKTINQCLHTSARVKERNHCECVRMCVCVWGGEVTSKLMLPPPCCGRKGEDAAAWRSHWGG